MGKCIRKNPKEQFVLVKNTATPIVDLVKNGNKVILAHGNGPQVEMINLAIDSASKTTTATPEMPFPKCGAMSQGYKTPSGKNCWIVG